MSRATSAPTPNGERDARALADLAAALIDHGFAAGASHTRVLEALLTAYVAVAETHRCCTAAAAAAAQRCAARLQRAAEHGPAATHLH